MKHPHDFILNLNCSSFVSNFSLFFFSMFGITCSVSGWTSRPEDKNRQQDEWNVFYYFSSHFFFHFLACTDSCILFRSRCLRMHPHMAWQSTSWRRRVWNCLFSTRVLATNSEPWTGSCVLGKEMCIRLWYKSANAFAGCYQTTFFSSPIFLFYVFMAELFVGTKVFLSVSLHIAICQPAKLSMILYINNSNNNRTCFVEIRIYISEHTEYKNKEQKWWLTNIT